MGLQIGDPIPCSYDSEAAYEQHVKPLIEQITALCNEHDIAIDINVTYSRTMESDDGGFNEAAACGGAGCNAAMHSMALSIGTAFTKALVAHDRDDKSAINDPRTLMAMLMATCQAVQDSRKEQLAGVAIFT